MRETDTLGKLMMEKLRDEAISFAEGLLSQHWKAPSLKKLQRELKALDKHQRELVLRTVRASIDSGVHAFLFALQEAGEDGRIKIKVNGKDIADSTDGLHGELFTPEGWQARFSAYGEAPKEA